MSKQALLLYPHQLFSIESIPSVVDSVVLVEEPLYFGTDKQYPLLVHKQRLVFHRATMRRYVEEVLWPAGLDVEYVEFHQLHATEEIVEKLKRFQKVFWFDVVDDVLSRRLLSGLASDPESPENEMLVSPNFYLSRSELDSFFADKKKSSFANFYQWQRERFNVLIDPTTYKPVGGKWSFDVDNRKRLPKEAQLPTFEVFGSHPQVAEACAYVEKHFADNPGSIADVPWPTNRLEAQHWLQDFLEFRLDEFGPYEDAIDGQAPWVYHSALSAVLNVGLLSPREVIDAALERHAKRDVPLASLEGFIRQVIGWREYVRGVYVSRHVSMRTTNAFNHTRRMTPDWYEGTTGIPPVDDVIKKVSTRAYAHHIERLMVLGNIMFLCEFHPDDVYRWFMEMFIDAYDWVMVPNVYGMSQYADGGSMTTKPYMSSSNYILNMSHYERGDWCDVWDGLYWRFVDKHRDLLAKNPRMSMMVRQHDRLSESRRRIIGYRAQDFLNTKTVL